MNSSRQESDRVRRHVKQLFSWKAHIRETAQASLEASDPDEKLVLLEAFLTEATRDYQRASYSIWFLCAYLGMIAAFVLNPRHPEVVIGWACGIGVGAAAVILICQLNSPRRKMVTRTLDRMSDFKLVPSLLSHREKIAKRFGHKSKPYRALNSALERLLPQVALDLIGNHQSLWRRTLSHFLGKPRSFPKITTEVLRLAPAFGDSDTLKRIEHLATKYSWGPVRGPTGHHDASLEIRDAATASAAALRDALERRRQNATLLRASAANAEPPSLALLRPSISKATTGSAELLRADNSDVSVGCEGMK